MRSRQSDSPDRGRGPESSAPGLLDLLAGEETALEAPGAGGSRFVLTNQRLIHVGGEGSVFAAARLSDVVAVKLERAERDRRSAVWGIIGVLAAIGVWQVTRNEMVGAIAGAVVGLISLALLADYVFRQPGLKLAVMTAGGPIGGAVDSRSVKEVGKLIARMEELRVETSSRERSAAAALGYRGQYRPRE